VGEARRSPERGADIEVVEAQRLLADGERPFEERLGLGAAALGAIEIGEAVERDADLGMVGSPGSLDGHPVHARRSLVALDLRQRLPQVVAFDNPLHRRPSSRRAFDIGCRRNGFGPFRLGGPGFTRSDRAEGQLQLVVLPLGHCEKAALERFPLDVNQNGYRGFPGSRKSDSCLCEGNGGGARWRRDTRRI